MCVCAHNFQTVWHRIKRHDTHQVLPFKLQTGMQWIQSFLTLFSAVYKFFIFICICIFNSVVTCTHKWLFKNIRCKMIHFIFYSYSCCSLSLFSFFCFASFVHVYEFYFAIVTLMRLFFFVWAKFIFKIKSKQNCIWLK